MKINLDKKGKVGIGIFIGLVILISMIILVTSLDEIRPPKDSSLNFNDLSTRWKINNEKQIYYFDKDSGLKFSNKPDYYENRLEICVYVGVNENCFDRLQLSQPVYDGKNIDLIGIYENALFNFSLTYRISNERRQLSWDNMTIQHELELIPKVVLKTNTSENVGIKFKFKDIKMQNDEANDYIYIGKNKYFLNQDLNLEFENITEVLERKNAIYTLDQNCYDSCDLDQINCEDKCRIAEEKVIGYIYKSLPYFLIQERNNFQWLLWDENLDYKVNVKTEENQYNAPITLDINFGKVSKATTSLYWYDPQIVFSDNFDDNSFNTNNWTEINQDSGGDVKEENQVLNITTGLGYAHTGSTAMVGIPCELPDGCESKNFDKSGNYTISFDWKFLYNETKAGIDGVFIQNANAYKDASEGGNRERSYYGAIMGKAIVYALGRGCLVGTNEGLVIAADDSSSSWHCTWEHEVFRNNSAIFLNGIWYNIKILVNWNTNYTELRLNNNVIANGTIGGSWINAIGNKFHVEFHVSHYPYSSTNEYETFDNLTIYDYWISSLSANESSGRDAIVEGINNIIPGSTVYTDFDVDVRYFDGTQAKGSFDKVAFYGNQTWVFNYITGNESSTNINSSSYKIFNVWEQGGLTYSQIVSQVESYINETKV